MDPFTNQPYAFDDQSVDPFEAKFNNGIREITVGPKRKTLCYRHVTSKSNQFTLSDLPSDRIRALYWGLCISDSDQEEAAR